MARGLSAARGAAGVVTAMALAATISSCSTGDALALAKKACDHVATSIAFYRSAERDPDAPKAGAEQAQAVEQLRVALPIAANAAGVSSQWQALMTTLSESTRLPESSLVGALQSQCAVATGS